MTGWREHILAEFAPGIARLTLAADPDGLLLEEGVLEKIKDRGYSLVPFDPASTVVGSKKIRKQIFQQDRKDALVV